MNYIYRVTAAMLMYVNRRTIELASTGSSR